MTLLLDTSLWIDFTRARSPLPLKQLIAPFVLDPACHLAEPVRFELLRSARPQEARLLDAQFAPLPCLATPSDFWQRPSCLGQACRQVGNLANVLSVETTVGNVVVLPTLILPRVEGLARHRMHT